MVSALAASALPSLVLARGHRIEQVPEIPLVVDDSAETLTKTRKALDLLQKLGAAAGAPRMPPTPPAGCSSQPRPTARLRSATDESNYAHCHLTTYVVGVQHSTSGRGWTELHDDAGSLWGQECAQRHAACSYQQLDTVIVCH